MITNVDFANAIVGHPAFAAGDLSTDFIEEHFSGGQPKIPPDPEKIRYMSIGAVLIYHTRRSLVRESLKPMAALVGGAPALLRSHHYVVKVEEDVFEVELERDQENRRWTARVNNHSYEVITPEFEYYRRRLKLKIDGSYQMFRFQYSDNHIQGFFCGIVRMLEVYTPKEWSLTHYMPREKKVVQENILKCPMPGMVVAVCVSEGTNVRRGDELIRMESMKMESGIASPVDGLVEKILVQAGQTVETDETLLTFKLS